MIALLVDRLVFLQFETTCLNLSRSDPYKMNFIMTPDVRDEDLEGFIAVQFKHSAGKKDEYRPNSNYVSVVNSWLPFANSQFSISVCYLIV